MKTIAEYWHVEGIEYRGSPHPPLYHQLGNYDIEIPEAVLQEAMIAIYPGLDIRVIRKALSVHSRSDLKETLNSVLSAVQKRKEKMEKASLLLD